MKSTLRLLSLILALVLCLSLAACSSADDKAFAEADALLAAGDYDGAIAAFSAIGRYQDISAKIAEAEKLRNDANAGFLFGKWVDILTETTFSFNQDGTGIVTYPQYPEATPTNITYAYSDGLVKITAPGIMDMAVQEIDGITHIIYENSNYDLVSEADYPALAPYKVDITLDNWQEYFEMRRADDVISNGFGEPEYRQAGYGFFLKDAYLQQLVSGYNSIDISLEVQYDDAWFTISGDFLSGDYELTSSNPPRWYPDPEVGKTAVITVSDRRQWNDGPENDFFGTVAASFTPGYDTTDNDITYLLFADNIEVIRIAGFLTLKR